jgi:serine protease AprX
MDRRLMAFRSWKSSRRASGWLRRSCQARRLLLSPQLLAKLKYVPDSELHSLMAANERISEALDVARHLPSYLIRQLVAIKIHAANPISGHYKHVDGTSFAAPIVSSVVAQMLEANPKLSPPRVKRILIGTAIRLPEVPLERQGWEW